MSKKLDRDFQLGDYVYSSFRKLEEDKGYIAKINEGNEYNKYVVCQNGKLKGIFSKAIVNPIKINSYFLTSNGYIEKDYIPKKENEFGGWIYTKEGYPTIFRSEASLEYTDFHLDVTYKNKEYQILYVHELQHILRENNLNDRFKI